MKQWLSDLYDKITAMWAEIFGENTQGPTDTWDSKDDDDYDDDEPDYGDR